MRSTRVSSIVWLGMLFACSIMYLPLARQSESWYVLMPAAVAIGLWSHCVSTMWSRDQALPVVDIGVAAVTFTTLYTVIPLLNFYLGGLEFGVLSDGRLQRHAPSAEELGRFFAQHVVYLAALVVAYSVFRPTIQAAPVGQVSPPRGLALNMLVWMFLILTAYAAVLYYVLGIGFRTGYGDESHIWEGPLWLQQINGKLSDLQFIFQAAVLAFMVRRKDASQIRYCLYLLIAWNVGIALMQPGSRSELLSLLLLTFLFWQKFHGTSLRFTMIVPPMVFALFMFLGLVRSFLNLGDMVLSIDRFETLASATNEFQSMLGTAFDVHKILERGADVPAILAFNDLVPLLPPQQLLPFPKTSGADWYLVQIGQDGMGIGYVWSVISQASIGFGIPELIARGVVLGWFLARVHAWYRRRQTKFLPTVIYVVLCASTVSTFRDTTGAILWVICWGVIPFAMMFYLIGLRSAFVSTSPEKGRAPLRSPQIMMNRFRVTPSTR
jgi:hypothetical protein